jgi:hypothetical protein
MPDHRHLFIGIALSAVLTTSAFAQSGGTKVGVLTCQTSASVGLIIGSHQRLRCSFSPDGAGPPERYAGSISRIGLDVGIRGGGVMVWAVVAPTNGYRSITLQPLSVSGQVGVNLALGVAGLTLRSVP